MKHSWFASICQDGKALSEQSEKLQNALDEGRTLILGAQIIIGLTYRSVFEPGYDRMPRHSQDLMVGALVLVLAAFVLLIGPVAYHRIAGRGANRPDLQSLVLAIMKPTLPLFALSMGLTIYIATEKIDGTLLAVLCSTTGAGLALVLWSGAGPGGRKSKSSKPMNDTNEPESLNDKIKHVLTEARMVLPGAQALLGFQFVTMLLEDFDRLPQSSKHVHLISLFATALTTVLLMAPAAHHRIVEKGASTEAFHRLAGLCGAVDGALGSRDRRRFFRGHAQSDRFVRTRRYMCGCLAIDFVWLLVRLHVLSKISSFRQRIVRPLRRSLPEKSPTPTSATAWN